MFAIHNDTHAPEVGEGHSVGEGRGTAHGSQRIKIHERMGKLFRPAVLIIRKDLDFEEEEQVRRQRILGAPKPPIVSRSHTDRYAHAHPPILHLLVWEHTALRIGSPTYAYF